MLVPGKRIGKGGREVGAREVMKTIGRGMVRKGIGGGSGYVVVGMGTEEVAKKKREHNDMKGVGGREEEKEEEKTREY
ncbi:hypothetical protein E2C01_060599 [Portunus trituberculatus]|uniref:Uncharacterized protein n=1 Tax=Portunus trituberculatus TaxID=210409 RepID=A0A5B7H1M1_PORTR|nr:hypothetical protein [Portunus trituberculatus]